jgi:hypothetical protein
VAAGSGFSQLRADSTHGIPRFTGRRTGAQQAGGDHTTMPCSSEHPAGMPGHIQNPAGVESNRNAHTRESFILTVSRHRYIHCEKQSRITDASGTIDQSTDKLPISRRIQLEPVILRGRLRHLLQGIG